jgi:ADP-heptose:LPS heptosyltransferase
MSGERILVIAAGGLGPLMQALPALAAIRDHHRTARIVALTAAEAVEFARALPYVDEVWTEMPPPWWQRAARRALADRLRGEGFARVYDLGGGAFGRQIFRLMFGPPADPAAIPWNGDLSGTALALRGAPPLGHLRDRLAAQLRAAGIVALPPPDLTWVAKAVTGFHLPVRMTEPFVLFATDPGPHGAIWPAERQAALAEALAREGTVPVLVGVRAAEEIAAAVCARCAQAVDLTARAAFTDLVFLAWAARGAVGADNGLMHLAAMAGCRAVVLYDAASDPARTGHRGADVLILRRPALAEIPVGEVAAALRQRR